MAMTKERAQRTLGRLLIRGLKRTRRVIYPLKLEIGVSPVDVANDIKVGKTHLHDELRIEKIIRVVFESLPRLRSRAFNLFHAIVKSARILRRLPSRKRKFIRNGGGYVYRPQYAT